MRSKVLNIQLGEVIKIPISNISNNLERKLFEKLVFPNPEYEKRHMMGMWIGNIPPTISCIRRAKRHYIIPRGFLEQLTNLCQRFKQPYKIIDNRRMLNPIFVDFHGYLKEYQQDAAEAILQKDFATIIGGYKSGKTVIALYTISERKQPTLVMIPKLDLLEGWIRKTRIFLQIPEEEIGLFIRGQKKLGKRITIAHTSEVMRHWHDLHKNFGYVIMDDANRCPHRVLTQIVPRFDSMYMLALCHELNPEDRMSQLITFYMGEVVYSIDIKNAREGRGIIKTDIIAKTTDFSYPYTSRADYLGMIQALMEDEARTELVLSDVENEISQGNSPVAIITGGPIQEEIFYKSLTQRGINAQKIIIPYDTLTEGEEESGDVYKSLIDNAENIEAFVLTSQTLLRCYRDLHIKALFLAVPLYFHDNLANAIRYLINHTNEEKQEHAEKLKIYDYVDKNIGLLENYFRMRSYNYGVAPDVLLKQR